MKYMLDTNICIYYIKNKPASVVEKFRINLDNGLSISTITLAELEHGVAASQHSEKNARALMQFLAIIDVLSFDDEAAEVYGTVCADLQKRGTPIGPLDTLIAAHAKSEGLILVTNNLREFERVQGLQIDNWV